jgi:hypothetical protein
MAVKYTLSQSSKIYFNKYWLDWGILWIKFIPSYKVILTEFLNSMCCSWQNSELLTWTPWISCMKHIYEFCHPHIRMEMSVIGKSKLYLFLFFTAPPHFFILIFDSSQNCDISTAESTFFFLFQMKQYFNNE